MKKRLFALILLLCMAVFLMVACDSKDEAITADEAKTIALEDMGVSVEAAEVHIHEQTVNETILYHVYVTANGESLEYVIHGDTGTILMVNESTHSH